MRCLLISLIRFNLESSGLHVGFYVCGEGGVNAEPGDRGVTAKSLLGRIVPEDEHHARATRLGNMIETFGGSALDLVAVVYLPVEHHPFTLDLFSFFRGEGLTAVTVAFGREGYIAGELIGRCLIEGEIERIVTINKLKVPKGAVNKIKGNSVFGADNFELIRHAHSAVGVRNRNAGCGVGGAARIRVGIAHAVELISVTRRRDGENTLLREGIHHSGVGVISRRKFAAEGQVDDISAIREIAVLIGI